MIKALLGSVFLCLMLSAYNQSFVHLTSNDGLPDNHARFVYQDSNGYIYVGTRNGLCRYDGYNFLHSLFSDSLNQAPKEFSAMIESDQGFFTVASSGIYSYSRHSNTLSLSKPLELLDEACFTIFDNNIYCGNSAGLFVLESKSQQWINCNYYVSGIDNIHVRTMLVSDNNELLIGTNRGLFRYGANMELLEAEVGNDPSYHNINGILQDNAGGFWISTFSNLY